MTEQEPHPVRTESESESGEHSAGIGGDPAPGETETASGAPSIDERGGPDALDLDRDAVLGILARGEDMGEAQIARETELTAGQVGSLLSRLQHDGLVERTASGSWRLSPGAATKTEPIPSPKEPRQTD